METRLKILDIWVDAITRSEAIGWVTDILKHGQGPHTVFASNPEKNFSVPKDPELYQAFERADLLLPDGVGMVWAASILYGVKIDRIPGAEFLEDICQVAVKDGYKVFIYGAKEEVNRKAAEALQERFPGLLIAGRANGYLSQDEMPELIKRINDSKAEIIFLALGSPRQEKWFTTYKDSLEHIKIAQGVGGTLDIFAGNVQRAPEIWRRYNAEWLYRLLKEPKRIKRQKVYPLFMLLVLGTKIGRILGCGEGK